jgi:hypothetical protein
LGGCCGIRAQHEAGKDSHGLERVEPHDGDELGKILILPTQQLDAAVSGDSALRDPVEDL